MLAGPNNVVEHFTSKYLDLPLGPLLPFGHGLSYSRFALGDPPSRTRCRRARRSCRCDATRSVTNVGDRDGDVVLLAFVHDEVASLAPAVRRLAAFERIPLATGEHRTVRFALGRESLGFWTNEPSGEHVVEPGRFTLTLTDGTTALDAELSVR